MDTSSSNGDIILPKDNPPRSGGPNISGKTIGIIAGVVFAIIAAILVMTLPFSSGNQSSRPSTSNMSESRQAFTNLANYLLSGDANSNAIAEPYDETKLYALQAEIAYHNAANREEHLIGLPEFLTKANEYLDVFLSACKEDSSCTEDHPLSLITTDISEAIAALTIFSSITFDTPYMVLNTYIKNGAEAARSELIDKYNNLSNANNDNYILAGLKDDATSYANDIITAYTKYDASGCIDRQYSNLSILCPRSPYPGLEEEYLDAVNKFNSIFETTNDTATGLIVNLFDVKRTISGEIEDAE